MRFVDQSANRFYFMWIMTKLKIQAKVVKGLSDFLTPVTVYLKLRDHFRRPVLLESNDFTNKEASFSFIGLDPIATFQVQNNEISVSSPVIQMSRVVKDTQTVPNAMNQFLQHFQVEYDHHYPFMNGLFGHTNFEAVQYFDSLTFDQEKQLLDAPEMHYDFYKYIIAFNHYKDEYYLVENMVEGEKSDLSRVMDLLHSRLYSTFSFEAIGREESNLTDEEFKALVKVGKHHCQMGDVFQLVFSRQFSQKFKGDEFQVYRVLRSINPSPYLFYFDLGNYKIMGSSPESQMVIKDGVAIVNPVAGTYRRSGNVEEDLSQAEQLKLDPKENAEHIMLVDLARNDLGRHAEEVKVKDLRKVHFYSHVMHLVSKVEGRLGPQSNPIQIFGDTFPAGTLSGAPKYRAIELIREYENQQRGFYGGAIGFIDLNGNMNQAILIRSFFSRDNVLYYQAGAGIVVSSDEDSETQEVNNKLGALTKAIELAQAL